MSDILKITEAEFQARKEIPRFPDCPELDEGLIRKVTETVFLYPDPQPADVLFIFGSSRDDEWSQPATLFLKGLAPIIYVGGGIGGRSFATGRFLSHLIRDDLVACGIPRDAILVDEESTNTLEDAVHGKAIFDQKGIRHYRILFDCKWPHAGRCLRTLKKVFPGSILYPSMHDFKYDGVLYTENLRLDWPDEERSRSFVWGEYQRILLYSSRGDICP
ncbi:MAG: YdcF family protein [Patescibacteria group bacterium]|nr:YdcF family protein [Patescibacteria group bacterium]MDE1941250.1 YdcF family protein [Patescibacteria group bacterium]MDE1966721.1 YdcF family protein [Patescibacteria group bacterium]